MAEKELETKSAMKKISAEDVLNYAVDVLSQRKSALVKAFETTTNPLDRLSFKDKIEELDIIISYLKMPN